MALPLGSCDPREDEHETCDDNRKAAGSRLVFRLHSLPHLSKLEWRSRQCCIFTWWNLGAQFIAQKLVSGASQDCICYLDACIVYLKTAVDNYRGGVDGRASATEILKGTNSECHENTDLVSCCVPWYPWQGYHILWHFLNKLMPQAKSTVERKLI